MTRPDPILVFAPNTREVDRWAREHRVPLYELRHVRDSQDVRGRRGARYVDLGGWDRYPSPARSRDAYDALTWLMHADGREWTPDAPTCSTADTLRHPAQPCGECPWRLDQPVGRFPAERYELLRNTSATVDGGSAGLTAPLFACHKSLEGREIACAGWLAVEGHDHVGVRLAVVTGRLDGEALHPGEGWPELYPSFDAMAEANGVEQ